MSRARVVVACLAAVGASALAAVGPIESAIPAGAAGEHRATVVVETGGASVRLATAGLLSSDEELDALAADARWLAHAFIEDAPGQAQAA